MAHSWVQMFDSQYEAFKTYCQIYPHNATLLVDTYNVLKSGVPDAIRAFDEVLKPLGIRKCGIRLDSGDMAYLTQEARRKLDAAGWTEGQISASNSLDEYIIQDLLRQGAKIDVFGEMCIRDSSYDVTPANEAVIHKTIKKVTEDVDSLKMNTAIAAMMTMVNELNANGCTRGDLKLSLIHILYNSFPIGFL